MPPEFCDSENVPITLTRRTAHKYLSSIYAADDKDALVRLGVTEMTIEHLIGQLEEMIRSDQHGFRSRPNEWHSKLAHILERRGRSISNKERIRRLELIPLRDGRWVSLPNNNLSPTNPICFPNDSFGFEVPEGLPVQLVADYAARDRNREVFYASFGVVKIDRTWAPCVKSLLNHRLLIIL